MDGADTVITVLRIIAIIIGTSAKIIDTKASVCYIYLQFESEIEMSTIMYIQIGIIHLYVYQIFSQMFMYYTFEFSAAVALKEYRCG